VPLRAGVSEGVFYDIFPTVEECYRAAFERGLERLSFTVTDAVGREDVWLERVRSGLVAMLGFFDDEPSWARVLVLETPCNGALLTVDRRQLLHDVLAGLLDSDGHADEFHGRSPILLPALTGEFIVGGVYSVIRTSILENDAGKLVVLAPSLMAFIAAPYLGHEAAQAELEGRPSPVPDDLAPPHERVRAREITRAAELPIRATHRTTLVLHTIARTPYSNNREVAEAAGLADEGQTSKLLTRLERQGVIQNVGVGAARGEPNAWVLTGSGRRAVELINESFAAGAPRQRRARLREAP
jgi:AcrR family transcriptional regulator